VYTCPHSKTSSEQFTKANHAAAGGKVSQAITPCQSPINPPLSPYLVPACLPSFGFKLLKQSECSQTRPLQVSGLKRDRSLQVAPFVAAVQTGCWEIAGVDGEGERTESSRISPWLTETNSPSVGFVDGAGVAAERQSSSLFL